MGESPCSLTRVADSARACARASVLRGAADEYVVFPCGKGPAPAAEIVDVDIDTEHAFGTSELAEDVAAGADGERAAAVFELGVFAAAVDAEDEGLIFDGGRC